MPAQIERFLADHWGDLASAIGLLVALVGFGVTIYKVARARDAADAAQSAAEEVRKQLSTIDTISCIAEAVSVLNEIKRLQRENAWRILPDRYSALRKLLILIRDANVNSTKVANNDVTRIIQHLGEIEKRIERSISTSAKPPSISNLNQELSSFADTLTELFAEIRMSFGERGNG